MSAMKLRLNKVISTFGAYSRRKADALIQDGKVTVNQEVCTRPFQMVSIKTAKIQVENKPLRIQANSLIYALNKPRGFVCSHRRFKPQENLVFDLFRKKKERLFTAGRLDKDSEGLLIVTNDGDLAYQLTHPSQEVQKEYLVKTHRPVKPKDITVMLQGVTIDGVHVKPVKVNKLRSRTVRFVLTEGKKHEVRLLCKKANLEVKQLKRIRIGNFSLGKIPLGSFKQLNSKEVSLLLS